MKYSNRFQEFFYWSFRIFGMLAVLTFILTILSRIVAPLAGMGIYPIYGLATLVWMASVSLAVFSLVMLSQNRPLHHHSLAVTHFRLLG
jgi:hypothetical protein